MLKAQFIKGSIFALVMMGSTQVFACPTDIATVPPTDFKLIKETCVCNASRNPEVSHNETGQKVLAANCYRQFLIWKGVAMADRLPFDNVK
jgi:hypothetical protein